VGHLQKWLPSGKLLGAEYQVGSLAGEAGRSLSINVRSGVWKDFATEQSGGDLVSLYAALKGLGQADALKELSWSPITPSMKAVDSPSLSDFKPHIPKSPASDITHHSRGRPDNVWEVKLPDGRLLFYTCRFNREGGKDVLGYSYGELNGRYGWHWKTVPDRRPLYGLHEYKGGDVVVVCEGEKARDAAKDMLGEGYCPVAWIGGVGAINKTDWSYLVELTKGKEVVIWPDADEPGQKAAKAISAFFTVSSIIDVSNRPNKWDAADALEEGMNRMECISLIAPKKIMRNLAKLMRSKKELPEDLLGSRLMNPGSLFLLAGAPKAGKSDLLLQWLVRAATGESFLGFQPSRPMKVFYMQAEIKEEFIAERITSMGLSEETIDQLEENFYITDRFLHTLDSVAEDLIREMRQSNFIPDIVVLDPLANFTMDGDENSENDNAKMVKVITKIRRDIIQKINPDAVLAITHHTSKMKRRDVMEDPFNSIRGASALRGLYDTGIVIFKPDEEAVHRRLFFELRNGPGIEPMNTYKVDGCWQTTPVSSERIANVSRGEMSDKERDRKYEVIIGILHDEAAEKGQLYTASAFSARFEGKNGLGSKPGLSSMLTTLANKHILKYSKTDYMGVKLANRSEGYLCFEGMLIRQLSIDKQGVSSVSMLPVEATHIRHKNTGGYEEIQPDTEIDPLHSPFDPKGLELYKESRYSNDLQ